MQSTNDVEMGEGVTETLQNGTEQITSQDLTDPLPPPQPDIPQSTTTEHLSTIQPGVPASVPSIQPPPAVRPGSVPPVQTSTARPEQPALHGGPTRQYLNQNITPHLLEGMKYLAMNEPEKPLAWLADFLKDRSKQVEG